MPKEYRTIREVAGPLMMISDVEDVKYDELGEIELPNGETRRCKVLEVNGSNALVQLFESAAGINLANSKVRFLGRSMELPVSPDMLSRVFDGLGNPIDDGPALIPEKRMDVNGTPMNPACREKLSAGIYSNRRVRHRRSEHTGKRSKAPDLLRFRSASRAAGGADRPSGDGKRQKRAVRRCLCRDGYHL